MHGVAAAQRQAQHKITFLRNAFLAAHQPTRAKLDVHLRATGQRLGHGHDHRQQHLVFIAVIGQGANLHALGQRPFNRARLPAGGQRPLQFGRQAGVPRIFPIGVPATGMAQLQTQPQRLAGANTLGRVGNQFSTYLRVLHHSRGITAPQHTGRARRCHAHHTQRQQ